MTDYSSVDRLQQAFDEARIEVRTYFDMNSQLLTALAAVRQEAEEAVAASKTQIQTLQQDNKHLRSSLTELNATIKFPCGAFPIANRADWRIAQSSSR